MLLINRSTDTWSLSTGKRLATEGESSLAGSASPLSLRRGSREPLRPPPMRSAGRAVSPGVD